MAYGKEQHKEKDPGTGYNKDRNPGKEHQKGDNPDQKITKDPPPKSNSSNGIKSMRWEH